MGACQTSRSLPSRDGLILDEDAENILKKKIDLGKVSSLKENTDKQYTPEWLEKALTTIGTQLEESLNEKCVVPKTKKKKSIINTIMLEETPVYEMLQEDAKEGVSYDYTQIFKKRDLGVFDNNRLQRCKEISLHFMRAVHSFFAGIVLDENFIEYASQLLDGKIYPERTLTVFEIRRLGFNKEMRLKNVIEMEGNMIFTSMIVLRCVVYDVILKRLMKSPLVTKASNKEIMERNLKLLSAILYYNSRAIFSEEVHTVNEDLSNICVEPYAEKNKNMFIDMMRSKRFYHLFEEDVEYTLELRKKILGVATLMYDTIKSHRFKMKRVNKKEKKKNALKNEIEEDINQIKATALKIPVKRYGKRDVDDILDIIDNWLLNAPIISLDNQLKHGPCSLMKTDLENKLNYDFISPGQSKEAREEAMSRALTNVIDYLDQWKESVDKISEEPRGDIFYEYMGYMIFGRTPIDYCLTKFEAERISINNEGVIIDAEEKQINMIIVNCFIVLRQIEFFLLNKLRDRKYQEDLMGANNLDDKCREDIEKNSVILASIFAKLIQDKYKEDCSILDMMTSVKVQYRTLKEPNIDIHKLFGINNSDTSTQEYTLLNCLIPNGPLFDEFDEYLADEKQMGFETLDNIATAIFEKVRMYFKASISKKLLK